MQFRSNHIQQATRKISAQSLLADWRVICEKAPKGFEKYFKDKAPAAGGDAGKSAEASASASSQSTNSSSSSSNTSSPKPTDKSAPAAKSNDWSFGMFTPSNAKSSGGRSSGSGSGGGSGKPLGEGEGSDRDKWLMFGAVSALAIAGAIVYFEVGYKEIGWKEFVNK